MKPTQPAWKPSEKPQCNAARAYIEALHAEKRGDITATELNAAGSHLNAMLDQHGKP